MQQLLKREIDFWGAVIGVIFLAIPFTLIALAIKLDSNGPIFFRQEGTRGCLEHGDLLS